VRPDETRAAIALLAETFPKCFAVFEQRRRPLKVGIHNDILARPRWGDDPGRIGQRVARLRLQSGLSATIACWSLALRSRRQRRRHRHRRRRGRRTAQARRHQGPEATRQRQTTTRCQGIRTAQERRPSGPQGRSTAPQVRDGERSLEIPAPGRHGGRPG
jgi:hypothetical protein